MLRFFKNSTALTTSAITLSLVTGNITLLQAQEIFENYTSATTEIYSTDFSYSFSGGLYVQSTTDFTGTSSANITQNAPGVQNADALRVRSGDFAAGTVGGTIIGTNTGDISTIGDDSDAIDVRSNGGNVIITNDGSLSTTGRSSRAIDSSSGNNDDEGDPFVLGGDVLVNNTGTLTTTGKQSHALTADSNGGSVTVNNSGTVSTSGLEAKGLRVNSGDNRDINGQIVVLGGLITLDNDGDISTDGSDARAIDAWSNGGNVNVDNSGALITKGDNSTSLGIDSGTNGTTDGRVIQTGGNVTGTNSGAISTLGNNSHALDAWSNGGDVNVNNSGTLNVSGADSRGLQVSSGTNQTTDNRVIQVGGDVTVINSGNIVSQLAQALDAYSNGGDVAINNTGNLSTTGAEDSDALRASSGQNNTNDDHVIQQGGDITVTNVGTLSTTGNNSRTINANSNGGDVTVTNSGALSTVGNQSDGINADSGSFSDNNGYVSNKGGRVTLLNNSAGAITTMGDQSRGVSGYSYGGEVSVTNHAAVTTSGDEAQGINAGSGEHSSSVDGTPRNGDNVSLTNTGNIITSGDDASGLNAGSIGGSVTVSNTGDVTVSGGNDTAAIQARSGAEITDSGGTLTSAANVTNSGTLTTTGQDSLGIKAESETTSIVNNTGNITISGRSAIEARGNTSASVTNEGNLSVARNVSNAGDTERVINVRSDGTSFISNSGDITAIGDKTRGLAASGLYNSEGGDDDGRATNAIITNSGTVTTNGEDSHGVDIRASSETTLSNTGTIAATGVGARAIQIFSSGSAVLNNSGMISNTDSRSAIGSTGEFASVDATGSTDLINNSGTISGGIFLGEKDDIIVNTGTLIGDILLGADNDTLNLDSSGDISGAMFFGDSDGFDPRVGTDTVNFDGDFTIDGSQFSEFENAVLLSGTHSGTGLDTFTQLFTVSAGATFNAGGATVTNLTSNGTTKVGSGETFNVTGDLNVAGAGILDIGIASASNFANFIVGGDAIIDSSGNLMISVDDTNSLVVTDTFSPLTANSITVGGATTGDSFTIKDNFLAFNFSGVVEAANSGQVLNVSLEEGFGQLIEEVSGGTAGELTKIVEFLDSTPATIEQQAVSDAIQEVLVTFDDTEIAELETFIEEISTAPGASSPSTNAGTSTVQSAGSLIQARVEQRVAAASPTTSQSSTTDFANNYAAAEEPQDSVFTQILVTENGYGFETNVANAFGGEWWVQSFGGVQSTKDDATNVSASNGGLSIGYDAFLESGALAGVGGVYTTAYSKTKVTGGSTTTARSNTFGALGYFGNTFDNGLGISTSLGYFLSDTDQKRFDSLNDTYNADQKSYTAYGSVNVSYAIDAANFVFTPNAGLTYTNVRQGGYTETSSTGGALSQTVSASTLNSLIGTFGGSLSKTERVNGINISAEIHAAALYELNDTLGSYSLSLGNGAISFASQNTSALDRLRGNIGGSLRFGISDTLTTQIGYDAVIGEKTQEHNVRFRIGKKF